METPWHIQRYSHESVVDGGAPRGRPLEEVVELRLWDEHSHFTPIKSSIVVSSASNTPHLILQHILGYNAEKGFQYILCDKLPFLQLPVLDVAAVGAVVDGLPQQTHPMVQQSLRRERGAIGTLDGAEAW